MHSVSAPSYQGQSFNERPGSFAELTSSSHLLNDPVALGAEMAQAGYLYLPGLLDADRVARAREKMLERLDDHDQIDRRAPLAEGLVNPGRPERDNLELASDISEVQAVLYAHEMMDFWHLFLGGEVKHLDYTWFRTGTAGQTTPPHCDTVFMNRGTPDLYTSWTPFMDVPYELGGLMILEESHTRGDLLSEYWTNDVDTYCTGDGTGHQPSNGASQWAATKSGGYYDTDAMKLLDTFQQRWLGAEYHAGDILVFGMHTLHASCDNHTPRFRLSTDSRYQLATEPADPRWIGPRPIGHGPNAKRGMIC